MSDDDSSSSEDLPLSALGKKDEYESSDEAEAGFDDEDEDEESGGEEYDSSDFIDDDEVDDENDDGEYSDSSDDAPLTSLKSKKAPKQAKTKPAKKSSSSKKAAPKKKAAVSAKKKKSASTKKTSKAKQSLSSSASNYLCASGELYSQCDKGKLIQSLLARWWYAYEWPDPKAIPASTPKGYDALDGFPGVFICTQGSNVGKFLDMRDHAKSPSFKNFAKKDSEELRHMLLRAIEEQIKLLVEHEGEGTDTEKTLRVLEKWAMKLNCAKADKEAVKVLKAKRLVLP
eukprot:CAMPEP_0172554108 /NCGR_PEP_ID=MMETSP1067-20121228/53200_1 /TAXON_ID=265564 ORGANISM="Thalassiosira punctigera, Strain Tpunct2005C2" /NCGR_SAMPLE_ID=MMETSP1067 /ASSEMBLY_ACC=CAM_ASM_000444 /LENGTH=285 /DNA_ID=CAMNT_0013342417 /DNA_START=116 /DNA_END=973 /DNA_ORIENTATION=-